MKIKNASNVDYDNPSVIKAIRESSDWLQEENLFGEVREHISCHCENVLTYAFMFTDENPLISRIEYEHISDKLSIVDQLKLIPSVLVDKECAKLLFNNWNAKHRNKNDAYSIIMYISNMEPEIAVYCLSNIDFKNSIYFHTLSNKRKETIKHAFAPILNLDDLSNKLQFMDLTLFLKELFKNHVVSFLSTLIGN